jgi:carbon-monoxide dehydrogenase small subunit
MHIVVNGVEHDVESGPLTSLLQVLREEIGLTSPKAGCQQGGCGTCTVLVDGEPRRGCLTAVGAVAGCEITTVEGLSPSTDALHPVQQAFQDLYAAQCGFCTPGMMMATVALLDRTPSPSREDIVDALRGHVCRCTGYVKILDAVESLAGGVR